MENWWSKICGLGLTHKPHMVCSFDCIWCFITIYTHDLDRGGGLNHGLNPLPTFQISKHGFMRNEKKLSRWLSLLCNLVCSSEEMPHENEGTTFKSFNSIRYPFRLLYKCPHFLGIIWIKKPKTLLLRLTRAFILKL